MALQTSFNFTLFGSENNPLNYGLVLGEDGGGTLAGELHTDRISFLSCFA